MKTWTKTVGIAAVAGLAGAVWLTVGADSDETAASAKSLEFEEYAESSSVPTNAGEDDTGVRGAQAHNSTEDDAGAKAVQRAEKTEETSDEAKTEIVVMGIERDDRTEDDSKPPRQKKPKTGSVHQLDQDVVDSLAQTYNQRTRRINPVPNGLQNLKANSFDPQKLPSPKGNVGRGSGK